MRKLLLMARSNMRKAKGQTIAIIVLILLAALMLNLWLMLSMDYKANFDRYHSKLNAEHITIAFDNRGTEFKTFLTEELNKEDQVTEFCLDECMHMVGTFPYNGGMMNGEFIFLSKEIAFSRSIGKTEMIEEGAYTSGVYLPMLYHTNEIKIGNIIEISIGSHLVRYTVCGFFNSVMMGSHNCALTEIVLTQDKYNELLDLNYAPQATLCSVRIKDISKNQSAEANLKSRVSAQYPNMRMASNCYSIVSQSRYISQGICSVILAVMAFLVLLIALVIIVSNIINYIQVNMKNLGALKAVGYTSKQLIYSLLLQFLFLTLLASIVGGSLSYGIFPAINSMMIAQTGIPYSIHFLPLPLFISFVLLCGTVVLSVWFSAWRIKKIEPIVALRAGVQTHNFKRNHIPLDKTSAPLSLALALKTTLSGIKHNLTMCITMLVLSLVVVFSGLITENIIADMTPFLNLIVGETADACINVNTDAEEDLLQMVNSDNRVEKAYLYNSLNISHIDGAELMATMCDDFSRVNNQSVIFKGRFPKFDNEIAIGAKYAKQKGLNIGEEIKITANGNIETYLICGFTQITNNLGRDCLLTREGYERLGTLSNVSYYLNLSKDTDVDRFNKEMMSAFPDQINTVINIKTTIEGASYVYVSLMTIIVVAILVISSVIVLFVLYLLVRTILNNKRRDYGILKSLGYTTKQLILQTALSFMPAIILSTCIGIIISCFVINPLMSLFMSTMGIMKCTFEIPFLFVTIAGIGLIVLSFGIACLLSFKVKKIVPRTLLAGE